MVQDFCDQNDHGGGVHRCLHAVRHLIEDHAANAGIPLRFAASKIIEGDELILDQLNLDPSDNTSPEFRGYRFKTSAASDIIDFPIAGYRHYQGDYPAQFIRSGGMTYYWSAEMYNQVGGAY